MRKSINYLCLLLLVAINCSIAKAQKIAVDTSGTPESNMSITISYFGNFLIDPGIKLGIERPFSTVEKSKIKKNGKQKVNQLKFLNTLNLGYYSTKELSQSCFLNSEIGYRNTKKSGFRTEVLVGLGYLRTFLTDETYSVDDNGKVSIRKNAGSNYFIPSFSLGIGYDNSLRHPNFPLAVSLRPNLFFRYPFNSSWLTHIAIELNLSYQISSKPKLGAGQNSF